MKKILPLLLFVLPIILTIAQKVEELPMLKKLNLKPIETIIDEQGRKIDKETGALRINRNEYFKSEAEDANEIAWSFLQTKQEVYGLSHNLNDIKIKRIVESPAGKYVYCRQYVNDIPVSATNFIIYINKKNIVTYTLNEFRNVAKYGDMESNPSITENTALTIANEYLSINGAIIDNPTELVYFESMDKGLELAWKINIASMDPMGDWQFFISAEDGNIIHVEDINISANGSGKIFNPNPLVSANVPYGYNNCYLHNNGATNSCLDGQLVQVTLQDLTYENGLYKLKGPYCVVQDMEPPNVPIPELSTPNFHYNRDQGEFGAVMCYYHIDLAARRILELGYNVDSLKYLRVDPHGREGQYNAFYIPSKNYITLGGGGKYVYLAEDADIIWHEYAHAIWYRFNPTQGTGSMPIRTETPSVKEGLADYWATSYKRSLYPNNWATYGLWGGMGDSTLIRQIDLDLVYPDNYQVDGVMRMYEHSNGQILSAALMKIWGDLGREITDKLFLEAHLIWGEHPDMRPAMCFYKPVKNDYF